MNHDKDVFAILQKEQKRQNDTIELIASENFVSKEILDVTGSVFINKYAEGYPGNRYYDGCEFVDELESLAIERLKKLFKCKYANVQPHSGSCANQAAIAAILKPGDKILGMSLDCGGHLSHGFKKNISGIIYESYSYSVNKVTKLIDYDEVLKIAQDVKPHLIIAGFSAYSRVIDWKKMREIADSVGAFLLCDIAHIAGLVVTEEYPSPVNYAHIITSTTHKTLRGARGGVIMTNYEDIYKKINSSLFPGKQGGPLMNMIAGKAVCFKEALSDEFKIYIKNVIKNAKILAKTLIENGIDIVTGGTDNHIVLVNLESFLINGKITSKFLDEIGITCNKNGIPFDKLSPFYTSGIRLGSAAMTTKGLNENDFIKIANIIAKLIVYIRNICAESAPIVNKDINKILFKDIPKDLRNYDFESKLKNECIDIVKNAKIF